MYMYVIGIYLFMSVYVSNHITYLVHIRTNWVQRRHVLGSTHMVMPTYHAIVRNTYKWTESSTSQNVPSCTTGHDPEEFGFSEECSWYTMQWGVCTYKTCVCTEHSSQKPNSSGSWPVVQQGTRRYILWCTSLCPFIGVSYYSMVGRHLTQCYDFHSWVHTIITHKFKSMYWEDHSMNHYVRDNVPF